ncbi:hypothetical protein ACFX2A_013673 [Malus domestica]
MPKKSFRNGVRNSTFDQPFQNLFVLTLSAISGKNIPNIFSVLRLKMSCARSLVVDLKRLLPSNPKVVGR